MAGLGQERAAAGEIEARGGIAATADREFPGNPHIPARSEPAPEEETSMDAEQRNKLAVRANWVRRKALEMAVSVGSGHVSTVFSQTELLVALYYGGILRQRPDDPEWPDRDRFLLSKGQGGLGLYPILADLGYFPVSDLDNFGGPGSRLGVHAEWSVPGIEVITGSLGHGLPIATGLAEALRRDGRDSLVVCMVGDAELYEGSNWEAALTAAGRSCEKLICVVDRNKQGVLGFTTGASEARDMPCLDPLAAKFAAFGFDTTTIDGHDFAQITAAFDGVRERNTGRPLAIVANTDKGRGASVMENKRMWHYRVPSGADLDNVRAELSAQGRRSGPLYEGAGAAAGS